jgi:hypothetical protein
MVGGGISSERSDRFRITTEPELDRVVLRVEGWLTAASLDLLEAACRETRARGERVVVELSGLRSLPAVEAGRLARLATLGVELTGASSFVAALMDADPRP